MTIWISEEVWDALRGEGARLHPLETGGMLLGWRDGGDRVVTGLVGAGPAAMHGRSAFLPDHAWQMRRLRAAFDASSGDLDYLGDWHTHPDGQAAMSAMDRATHRRIARRVRTPIMVVAAGGPAEWRAAGWICVGRQLLRRAAPAENDVRLLHRPSEWPRAIFTD